MLASAFIGLAAVFVYGSANKLGEEASAKARPVVCQGIARLTPNDFGGHADDPGRQESGWGGRAPVGADGTRGGG